MTSKRKKRRSAVIRQQRDRLVDLHPETMLRWRPLMPDLPGWIRNFDNEFSVISHIEPPLLPMLYGKEIAMASDYSGDHSSSRFHVISTVLVDRTAMTTWDRVRSHLRNEFLKDDRRISFKRLGDKRRQSFLPNFLSACDELPGINLVVCVHKDLPRLFLKDLQFDKAFLDQLGKDDDALEQAIRVAFFNAFLFSNLCSDGLSIEWISDEDRILSKSPMASLIGRFIQILRNSASGHVFPLSTSADTVSRDLEDFAAIPDLSAGLMSYIATKIATSGVPALYNTMSISTDMAPSKGDAVFQWWMRKSKLRKIGLMIFPATGKNLYEVRLLVPGYQWAKLSNLHKLSAANDYADKRKKEPRRPDDVGMNWQMSFRRSPRSWWAK